MTTIATFPAPSDSLVTEAREGSMSKAARTYVRETTTVLATGTEVRMTLGGAIRCFKAIRQGLPALPVACTVDERGRSNYEPASLQAERDAAVALKRERFTIFCKEDGHDGTRAETEHCETCGCEREGTTHFAPNAMGYPTPVLWTCGTCGGSD